MIAAFVGGGLNTCPHSRLAFPRRVPLSLLFALTMLACSSLRLKTTARGSTFFFAPCPPDRAYVPLAIKLLALLAPTTGCFTSVSFLFTQAFCSLFFCFPLVDPFDSIGCSQLLIFPQLFEESPDESLPPILGYPPAGVTVPKTPPRTQSEFHLDPRPPTEQDGPTHFPLRLFTLEFPLLPLEYLMFPPPPTFPCLLVICPHSLFSSDCDKLECLSFPFLKRCEGFSHSLHRVRTFFTQFQMFLTYKTPLLLRMCRAFCPQSGFPTFERYRSMSLAQRSTP